MRNRRLRQTSPLLGGVRWPNKEREAIADVLVALRKAVSVSIPRTPHRGSLIGFLGPDIVSLDSSSVEWRVDCSVSMKSTDAKRWPEKCSEFITKVGVVALTGVDAHANSAFIFNSIDDLCQLFKLAAEHVSRPCLKMAFVI
jgi:hypothetical protein